MLRANMLTDEVEMRVAENRVSHARAGSHASARATWRGLCAGPRSMALTWMSVDGTIGECEFDRNWCRHRSRSRETSPELIRSLHSDPSQLQPLLSSPPIMQLTRNVKLRQ